MSSPTAWPGSLREVKDPKQFSQCVQDCQQASLRAAPDRTGLQKSFPIPVLKDSGAVTSEHISLCKATKFRADIHLQIQIRSLHVARSVKLPSAVLASHMAPFGTGAVSLSTWLPANAPGEAARRSPSAQVPAVHVAWSLFMCNARQRDSVSRH